jgi:hypothetical protein
MMIVMGFACGFFVSEDDEVVEMRRERKDNVQ